MKLDSNQRRVWICDYEDPLAAVLSPGDIVLDRESGGGSDTFDAWIVERVVVVETGAYRTADYIVRKYDAGIALVAEIGNSDISENETEGGINDVHRTNVLKRSERSDEVLADMPRACSPCQLDTVTG